MESLRKRPARQPLKESSGNVPSPNKKRLKLDAGVTVATGPGGNGAGDLELKLAPSLQPSNKVNKPQKTEKARTNRLVGDELSQWRSDWRKIMKSSVVYFDTQGVDTHNTHHTQEQRKANRGLRYVGSLVVPFYDKDVTIIVSRRPFNANVRYPSNDIFHDASNTKIKVWNFDKVFRFLKHLGVNDNEYMNGNQDHGDLVNLLKEEKIFGSTDKDPNAKREDLHYLDNNYLYVYDLAQNVRPIAVREWYAEDFPKFHLTLDGKCPFIPDSENSDRKRIKRSKKLQESEEYRHHLRVMSYELVKKRKDRRSSNFLASQETSSPSIMQCILVSEVQSIDNNGSNHRGNDAIEPQPGHQLDQIDQLKLNQLNPIEEINDTNTNNDSIKNQAVESDNDSTISQGSNDNNIFDNHNNDTEKDQKFDDFRHPKPSLVRNSSCLPTNNSNRFYDVAASGFNGESNAIQSIDSGSIAGFGGNGLGPTMSQVPSKNVNNLKRRIFMKKQKQIEQPDKEFKPGYCENCRIKYDHFEDHISSSRHRKFALNDSNFKEIDNLIRTVNENKLFGLIPSDGDFSYTE